MRTCTAGACGVAHAPSGTVLATQTAGDCAKRTCNGTGAVVLDYDATDAPAGKSCPSTAWQPASSCGAPPASPPAVSWADCSAGADPTKNGGDLLWVDQTGFVPWAGASTTFGWRLTAGPTGDVALGITSMTAFLHGVAVYKRLNGSGARLALRSYDLESSWYEDVDAYFTNLSIGPTNDLFVSVDESCQGVAAPPVCASGISEVDAPDGTIISPPTWVSPTGTLKTATSTTSIDLGCGALPAAPGGSTFVTRIDAMGNCLYARALPVPGLSAVMDATGRVVVSGFADAVPVDLGGGALAPLGQQDLVLAELDAAGNHLWSRRFGGPDVSFASFDSPAFTAGSVFTSAAGDVYLVTSFNDSWGVGSGAVHAVDLGGGGITAQTHDPIIASYSPSGAHRWSRAYHFSTTQLKVTVDGCGSLIVASPDVLLPNCGQAGAPFPVGPAIARFAP